MTSAELRFGAKEAARREFTDLVEAFLERLAILDWTADVTFHYATIRCVVNDRAKESDVVNGGMTSTATEKLPDSYRRAGKSRVFVTIPVSLGAPCV